MAGRNDIFEGVNFGEYRDSVALSKALKKYVKNKDVFFLCVGTDRSTGDSFAPFVGTYLKERGYGNVLGTIDNPVHAQNLEEMVAIIPANKTIIAIDASLGKKEDVGTIFFSSGKLHAGKGTGKDLTPVGDFVIHGVVNRRSNDYMMNFNILGSTRLSSVLEMAKRCVSAIEDAFPAQETPVYKILSCSN